MAIEVFDKSDTAYLSWVYANPSGFVLNRRRGGLSKNYLMLHTAGCPLISSYGTTAKPGGFAERKYIKACSDNLSELRSYVRSQCDRADGTFTGKCKICSPNAGKPRTAT